MTMRDHLVSLYELYGIKDPLLFETIPERCERQWNIYWDIRNHHCEPGLMGGESKIVARHILEWQQLNDEEISKFDREAIMLMDRTYLITRNKGDKNV